MSCRTSIVAAVVCLALPAHAAEPPTLTLFENVRIFDGKSEALSARMNVLIRGHTIEKVSTDPILIAGSPAAKIIDGGGRTLMPGLIDAHRHTMLVRPTPTSLLADDLGYLNLVAGAEATDTLMRGFTTVRDMGGPSFGLKRAIDEGVVIGPRIYPSGATGGHQEPITSLLVHPSNGRISFLCLSFPIRKGWPWHIGSNAPRWMERRLR